MPWEDIFQMLGQFAHCKIIFNLNQYNLSLMPFKDKKWFQINVMKMFAVEHK